MGTISIYALKTEQFSSEQDYYDRSPDTAYFYVGRTKDMQRRKQEHVRKAKRGSTYPYYEKIRGLGDDGWDIEELARVEKDAESDHEEYHLIKLTCDGHALLNIKRGNTVREAAKEIVSEFERRKIKSSDEYSDFMKKVREEKIKNREFKQIRKNLKHLQYDDETETHSYMNMRTGEIHHTSTWVLKDDLAEQLCPSEIAKFNELLRKIEIFRISSRSNDI